MSVREQPLFTFAILTDTHIRPPEGDESSPWEVNKKANGRTRYVVERLREASPDFAIHVGDMVHPVPSLPSFGSAAKAAIDLFSSLDFPVHFIPGNHDIGDKPLAGLPADPVTEEAVATYGQYFGSTYTEFEHGDCQFILLNAEIINSGLPTETKQREWLEGLLASKSSKRRFVFIHYPPFLFRPDEESSYDNIDEPGRSWLLDLLVQGGVETVFSGHVHHYFHHWYGDMESYILPAICFTRQDYSELFRIGPAADAEHGRDDSDKLGFCLVDVYPDKHIVRVLRTHGRSLEEGEKLETGRSVIRTHHPKDNMPAPLGLHMRHPWAEVVACPHTPNDEFVRKRVRNDYPFLALQELGTRLLRVPISDLAEDDARERMVALNGMGVKFVVFLFNNPTDTAIDVLSKHRDLVETVELIYDWRQSEKLGQIVSNLKSRTQLTVHVSRVESGREQKQRAKLGDESTKFSHFVSTGFSAGEWEMIDTFTASAPDSDSVDGYGFRLGYNRELWPEIVEIDRCAKVRNLEASVYVKLASDNPAEYIDDDLIVTNRIAEAMVAAFAVPRVQVFLDTFCDIDRGYFPRHGLYDRRYNPRAASFVYRHLQTYLAEMTGTAALGACVDAEAGRIGQFEINGRSLALVLPGAKAGTGAGASDLTASAVHAVQSGKWIDLVTGEIFKLASGATSAVTEMGNRLTQGHQLLLVGR